MKPSEDAVSIWDGGTEWYMNGKDQGPREENSNQQYHRAPSAEEQMLRALKLELPIGKNKRFTRTHFLYSSILLPSLIQKISKHFPSR